MDKTYIDALTNSEEYKKLPAGEQRKQYAGAVREGLVALPAYQTADDYSRNEAVQQLTTQNFVPLYENPAMQKQSQLLRQTYAQGNEQTAPLARDAMIGYYKGSYFNERASMSMRLLGSVGNTEAMNIAAGIPGSYANSVLAVNQTRGADDNKLRAEIMKTFNDAGDEDAIKQINKSGIEMGGTATRVIEGVLLGIATAGIAGAVTGLGSGALGATGAAAKAGLGVKAVAKALVSKTMPVLMAEAGLEGALGIAEHVLDSDQAGMAPSIAGASRAFGLYAGLDVAANLVFSTMVPLVRYSALPFTQGTVKKFARTIGASGEEMIGGVGLANQPRAIQIAETATNTYRKTTASFKSEADLEGLTEFQRANYDGYEAGYSVIQEGDAITVAPFDMPKDTRQFKNVFEAKEWMATRSAGGVGNPLETRINQKILAGNSEDMAGFIERHATTYKRFISRNNLDAPWTSPKKASKNFTPANKRQIVSPEEADAARHMIGNQGRLVQFDIGIPTAKLKNSKASLFTPDMDMTIPKGIQTTNGNAYVYLQAVASPEDWKKAVLQGQDAVARGGGNFTPEEWATDRLIGQNFQGADLPDGSVKAFFPDKAKFISDRIDPATGQLGNVRPIVKATAGVDGTITVRPTAKLKPTEKKLWVKSLIESNKLPVELGENGTYKYMNSIKQMRNAANADDLANKIIVENMDSGLVKTDLIEQGMNLTKAKGIWKVTKGNKVLGTGTHLADVLNDLDYTPKKIPESFAPQFPLISRTPQLDGIATDKVVIANQPRLNSLMSNFGDYRKQALATKVAVKPDGRTINKLNKALYEVEIPAIGFTKQTSSAKNARKYLEGGWKDFDEIRDAGMAKGYRIGMKDGKFTASTYSNTVTKDTLEELHEVLKNTPSPNFGKSIIPADVQNELDALGIHAELPPGWSLNTLDAIDDIPVMRDTIGPENKPALSFLQKMKTHRTGALDFMRGKRSAIHANIADSGITEFSPAFTSLESTLRRSHNKHQVIVNKANEIFTGINSKQRTNITHYLEAIGPDARRRTANTLGMNSAELKAAEQVEQVYKDLSVDLNINYLDLLEGYQPHLRAWSKEVDAIDITDVATAEYMLGAGKKYFKTPEIREFFARFDRVQDLAQYARMDDSLELLLSYSRLGHNEFYVRDTWKAMDAVMKKNKDAILDTNLPVLMAEYREAIIHPTAAMATKQVNRASRALMKKFGLDEANGRKMVDLWFNGSYQVNMAFRPWQPFRNIWQIYNILPAMTGNINVSTRAMKKMLKDPEAAKVSMIARGVFSDDSAYADELAKLYGAEHSKGVEAVMKFGRKGLKWFSASDHSTRIIAGYAADELMDKAIAKSYTGSTLNDMKFLRESRLEVFPESVRNGVMDLMQKGNHQGAKDVYAREMVNMTMFDYSKFNKPVNGKGMLGSMFYQYMTYPINVLNTLHTVGTNGSISARAKGFIALGIGSTAVAQSMKALGVNNSGFLLWNQTSITGGPLWEDMYNFTQLRDEGQAGDAARRHYMLKFGVTSKQGKLAMTKFPQALPGRIQVNYFNKAIAAYEAGNIYAMIMALTSTPMDKSWAEARGVGQ